MTDLPYRPGVGVMLLNSHCHVFVGQRIDNTAEAWQMPQGGIDEGEDPRQTALRELEEETGIGADLVDIITETADWLTYDLPEDLISKLWKGRYRGQRQKWFLAKFLGEDRDVNLATPHPEFRAWKWAEAHELPHMIVPFKQQLYAEILGVFRPWLK